MPPGVLKLRQDSQRKLVSFQVSIQVASFLLEPEILDIFLKIVILHVVQGTVENANREGLVKGCMIHVTFQHMTVEIFRNS